MKIGLVLPKLPDYSETFFKNKIRGLQDHGFEVVLYVHEGCVNATNYNCRIYKAPKLHGRLFLVVANTILELLKAVCLNPKRSLVLYKLNKNEGAPVHSNLKNIISNQFLLHEQLDWLHFGFGTLALGRESVAQVIGAKMAVSFRGFDIGVYPIKHPDCYTKLWTKVDKLHVISDDLKDLVYQNGFNDQAAIVKITPAIDTTLFTNNLAFERHSPLRFLTVARLHWKKGLDYTLEALALLRNSGVAFHYTIIGDGPAYESLVFAAHQLGLIDCITFAGRKTVEEVKSAMVQSDIYLQYSVQEGFCNAVLEAQAMGLLCLVSDAEGLSENVLDGQTGWVVKKRNPEALKAKLSEVLNLSEEAQKVVIKNAVERTKTLYNLKLQAQYFVDFYSNTN